MGHCFQSLIDLADHVAGCYRCVQREGQLVVVNPYSSEPVEYSFPLEDVRMFRRKPSPACRIAGTAMKAFAGHKFKLSKDGSTAVFGLLIWYRSSRILSVKTENGRYWQVPLGWGKRRMIARACNKWLLQKTADLLVPPSS